MMHRDIIELNGKFLIVTEVIHGSGDLTGAAKLINSLKARTPYPKIQWLIFSPPEKQDSLIKPIQKIQSKNPEFEISLKTLKDKIDVQAYIGVEQIILFPTVHHLSYENFNQLQRLRAPMLHIYEYDGIQRLHQLKNKANIPKLQTGFKGLGLLLEAPPVDELRSELDAIFSKESGILTKPDTQTYFSYTTKDIDYVINDAKFKKYFEIILRISAEEKSIDVITNFEKSKINNDFLSLAWQHGFTDIEYLEKHNDSLLTTTFYKGGSNQKRKVLRFVNAFPFSQTQVQALMLVCEPFQMVMGDQSLTEVISLAEYGKYIFPFYSIMYWKNDLYYAWLEFATIHLGEKSHYVELLSSLAPFKNLDAKKFAEHWLAHKNEILKDCAALYDLLKNQKNLSEQIIPFLIIARNYDPVFIPLIEQLITKKLKQDEIQSVISIIEKIEIHQHQSVIDALHKFLMLNVYPFNLSDLEVITSQFVNVAASKRIYVANAAREFINNFPQHLRADAIRKIVPIFSAVDVSHYYYVIDRLKTRRDVYKDVDVTYIEGVLDKYKESIKELPRKEYILLAVNVWEDGVGDLDKYIGVYQELVKVIPAERIKSLITATVKNQEIVLAMLRENNIPIKDTLFIHVSSVEQLFYGTEGSEIRFSSSLAGSHFDFNEYALIMSIATPSTILNHLIERLEFVKNRPHFIELAEVNSVSFTPKDILKTQHGLSEAYEMGLDDTSVGIEISATVSNDLMVLFSKLSEPLARKLLDHAVDENSVQAFHRDTFFMPAYLKYEEGILSIRFALQMMETQFGDKKNVVLWLHTLPFNVKSKEFYDELKKCGYKRFVLYHPDNTRDEMVFDQNPGDKQLRIVVGKVKKNDFNILYSISSKTGGFAGCVGQNSFEKTVSFETLPIFYAPPWQLPIISQCQALLAKLFDYRSQEYQTLDNYFELLKNIALFLQDRNKLSHDKRFHGFARKIQQFSSESYSRDLTNLSRLVNYDIKSEYVHAFQEHPLRQIADFFANNNLAILQSSWLQVCQYIKRHKNLNQWLVSIIRNYAPQLSSKAQIGSDKHIYGETVLASSLHNVITDVNYPGINKFIKDLFINVWRGYEEQYFNFIIIFDKTNYIEIIDFQNTPTIAISIHGLLELTVEEYQFAARFWAECYKKYPIETGLFPIEKLSVNELLKNISENLPSGIAYCRKVIKRLTQLIEKADNIVKNTEQFRIWHKQRSAYQEMIQAINLKLSSLHKDRTRTITEGKQTQIPKTVIQEAKLQKVQWEIKSIADKEEPDFEGLMFGLTSLSVKTFRDYADPSREVLNYLYQFSNYKLPESQSLRLSEIEQLLIQAYNFKYPRYEDLYLIACKKLGYKTLPPLGMFRVLSNAIDEFVHAASLQQAIKAAQVIDDFISNADTRLLFINPLYVAADVVIYNTDIPGHIIDQQLCSPIGMSVDWNIYQNWPKQSQELLIRFAHLDPAHLIARVLFKLGAVNETRIYSLLSMKDFKNLEFILKFNKYPPASLWEERHKTENRYYDFLCSNYWNTNVNKITSKFLNEFIKRNIIPLAIPDKNPEVATLLMNYFKTFLEQDKQSAINFITMFFLNKLSETSIFAISDMRNSIVNHGSFDIESYNQVIDPKHFRQPYLNFIFNILINHLDLHNIINALALFTIVHGSISHDFIYQKLGIKISTISNAITSVKILNDFYRDSVHSYFHIHDAAYFLILRSIHAAPDISLFTPVIYDLLMSFEHPYSTGGHIYDYLWKKTEASLNATDIVITVEAKKMAWLYLQTDLRSKFPNPAARYRFGELLLTALNNEEDKEKISICEDLLFRSIPLNDIEFVNKLIKIWVAIQAKKYGKDDKSEVFYHQVIQHVDQIIHSAPNIYRYDMLNLFLNLIEAQYRLCFYVSSELKTSEASISTLVGNINKDENLIGDYLRKFTKSIADYGLSTSFINFLITELTEVSQEQFLKEIRAKKHYYEYQNMSDVAAKFMLITTYHQFWNLTLEARAVIINHLLIPSSQLSTEESEKKAYTEALAFVTTKLFPDKNSDAIITHALMVSWLAAGNQYVRPYLLAGIMGASKGLQQQQNQRSLLGIGTFFFNKKTEAKAGSDDFYAILPRIAESMGGYAVKAAQGVENFPFTPPKISDSFKYLKSQARLLYRWELWELIHERLPADSFNKINYMRGILGGASFYVAAEIVNDQDQIMVLRLLRQNAHEEIQTGFAHLNRTLQLCQHPQIMAIKADVKFILAQAERSAQSEVSEDCALLQYAKATKLYTYDEDIKLANQTYHVHVRPVTLFESGAGYQTISKASGTIFNVFALSNPEIAEVAAFVIFVREVKSMLQDEDFDPDRHCGQTFIAYSQDNNGRMDLNITHIDYGEILPKSYTSEQKQLCRDFLTWLYAEKTSAWSMLKMATGVGDLFSDLNTKLIQFLRNYKEAHPTKSESEMPELDRLRAMFKGILALQDYYKVLSKNKELLNSAKQIIGQEFMRAIKPRHRVEPISHKPRQ